MFPFQTNGHEEPQHVDVQPPATGKLWADMFGLGPFLNMLSDPALLSHMHAALNAAMEAHAANRRIEAKLDYLISELQHASATRSQQGGTTIVLEQHRSDGDGRPAAAGGVADHGDGGPASIGLRTGDHG